jgi:hypothetical protein
MILASLILAVSLLARTSAVSPPPQGVPPDPATVLMRASAYVASYVKSLSSVVSEERYEQTLTRKRERLIASVRLSRTLVSDYLLVAVAGTSEWMPFRDVYSVDGKEIRDRSDRLVKLFIDSTAGGYAQALRIRDESSRYNLGGDIWDMNVPTFALQFLSDELRGRFTFRLKGREQAGDVDAVVVDYQEASSPTVIVGRYGEDVPSRGRFWIDPADGRILRTTLETRPPGCQNSIDVAFRYEPSLSLLVPGRMTERRDAGLEVIEGRATYSNFRRFRVDTSIEIK